MKQTGIVRKVDELGRSYCPLRCDAPWTSRRRTALEIYVEGSSVILKKYKPHCLSVTGPRTLRCSRAKTCVPDAWGAEGAVSAATLTGPGVTGRLKERTKMNSAAHTETRCHFFLSFQRPCSRAAARAHFLASPDVPPPPGPPPSGGRPGPAGPAPGAAPSSRVTAASWLPLPQPPHQHILSLWGAGLIVCDASPRVVRSLPRGAWSAPGRGRFAAPGPRAAQRSARVVAACGGPRGRSWSAPRSSTFQVLPAALLC